MTTSALDPLGEGKPYATDGSFRARAEAQQRRYRAEVLKQPWNEYGHMLAAAAADAGKNFVHPESFRAAQVRLHSGKGVTRKRTFGNMLASQAMCFNIFGPLAQDWGLETAAKVLRAFVPAVYRVKKVTIEHTPEPDVFGDQTLISGVDCDVLIDFTDESGSPGVLVVETKFVEEEFSTCGIRRRKKKPCPLDMTVARGGQNCGYDAKGYRYWQRVFEHGSLPAEAIIGHECPFGGELWQLWVNHTLAYEEAHRRRATYAIFAVCAPEKNDTLDARVKLMSQFGPLIADRASVAFIPAEELIATLADVSDFEGAADWARALADRYIVR